MSNIILGINEIFNYLPQRPPFLLIDRVIDLEEGKSITAIKNVTINEPFFIGHFPLQPIMPGVLIIEALGQAATVCSFYSFKEDIKNSLIVLAEVNNARFKQQVVPGDQLVLKAEIVKRRRNLMKIQGIAKVKDNVVCEVELTSFQKTT